LPSGCAENQSINANININAVGININAIGG